MNFSALIVAFLLGLGFAAIAFAQSWEGIIAGLVAVIVAGLGPWMEKDN